MKVDLINHSCIKISFNNNIKILFDPWFDGNVFEEGWGLKYYNPQAFKLVKDCDYLWISHFHNDHFHIPTLKKIIQMNPDIKVFENNSYNFQFKSELKNIGFNNIISLLERKEFHITNDLIITRYPTTGIDNMLYIKSEEGNILNYNDCNIPTLGRKLLSRKIDKVDILLNNFNHAGKLFDYPNLENNKIQEKLIKNFFNTVNTFNPTFTVPFASFHYYRSPESIEQNTSLIDTEDLSRLDESVIPVKVGDEITFDKKIKGYSVRSTINITLNEMSIKQREQCYSINELQKNAKLFCENINFSIFKCSFWIPHLLIEITDLNLVCSLNISGSSLRIIDSKEYFHISSTSQELNTWWSKPFGTDGFTVGAHFTIHDKNLKSLKIIILLSFLYENKLDFKSLIKMCFKIKGLQFLWNRREEIISLALTKNLHAGVLRE